MITFPKDFPNGAAANVEQIASFEHECGVELPYAYKQFLGQMNGGEGPIGNAGYIVLWSIEKSRDFHTHERFNKTSAKYIPIGSNGGGELLVIRYSGNDATFGYMPFIDPSDDNFVVINCDFWKALELIGEGRAFG